MPDIPILLLAEHVLTVAYVVFGMLGFGSTLLAAPILAHVMPVTTVVPTLAMTDVVAAWSNGWRLNEHVVRGELYRLVPALVIGSAFGAWVLFSMSLKMLMTSLGIFVMLYAINGLRPKHRKLSLSARWAWFYGLAGGTLSALFGSGGWVYSIYLLGRLDDPQQIRATQTAVIMFSSLVRVALFLLAGRLLDADLLLLVLLLLPAVALGLFIGNRISHKLNRQTFMQLLYGMLLLTGGSLVIRALQ